ncbi:MerR family transcriptional regulator [Brevibacterium sp. GP-SGM9]|uniref:MerR family transcriptional regulator n=1 Tax=unclassified Brevibacterium TaxID=2614124 RepID=UPI0022A9D54A|nr:MULTISPECIES: MerR family transcriptional regulator [unclassified Brevibacterium]MCD1286120.1 peroxiredoxin [Brevibacterium sp. CCUG 69071]MDK8433471.1 redoxin family protein [Brevibacterium sp. H-BE7]
MRIGEAARRAGVTVKAVRYYERLGLLSPERNANGYRDYGEDHVRILAEIHDLSAAGISVRATRPFVECLKLGSEHSDDCVSSLAEYRRSINEIDRLVASLTAHRARLVARLDQSAARGFDKEKNTMTDYTTLPDGLPVPEDDGAADHLPGTAIPDLTLPSSDGGSIKLGNLGPGRVVIYLYPLTGRPGVDLPDGWDSIPGARGCSTEACNFRDHFDDLKSAGAELVYGLSSQDPVYQAEVVDRLRLPFPMISDEAFALGKVLNLPTFSAPSRESLYARLTLIIRDGVIEHVFYPIFPPNEHAGQVLEWLRGNG